MQQTPLNNLWCYRLHWKVYASGEANIRLARLFMPWQKTDRAQLRYHNAGDDNMLSLCISEVQPSPKWHTDNNIHSCCIETKDEAFLIIDKQHIFTFPHLKVISPWSSTQCLQCEDVPIKKQQAHLLIQEDLARKQRPLCCSSGWSH